MTTVDHRNTIAFLLGEEDEGPDHVVGVTCATGRGTVPLPSTVISDITGSSLARRRFRSRQQERPAICAVMQPKLGANPWREALRPAPRPMLGAIVGVDEHREVRDGLVELYVHCVRMGRDGNRFMCGSWVPEWVVQGQRENVVLSYWRGLGGRDVALGPRKRHYPLKILARNCGGWCLVQWIGYPSWPPFATWVRRPDW
ncbi:hypothetical protein GGR57DRAFT_497957 [Xylariaceae sp. FL1272]|nr:hypothetical protein GGR57DRAFT_497957 [Xylariaceae sp. FL1272]